MTRHDANGEPYLELSEELALDVNADVIFATPPFAALAADADAPLTQAFLDRTRSTEAAKAEQIYAVGGHWTSSNVAACVRTIDELERFLDEQGDTWSTTYTAS